MAFSPGKPFFNEKSVVFVVISSLYQSVEYYILII